MEIIAHPDFVIAAAGYSLVWLLAGGGLFGAFVIFVIMKLIGK